MEGFNRRSHWENVYQTKKITEVSWFQPTPETSINFINEFNLPKSAKIIDIGGGTTDIAVISLGGIVRSKNLKIARINYLLIF